MLHREAQLRIMDTRPGPRRIGLHHDEAAVDLLPPVHAGGILLPHEATLGEADAIQLCRIALEPEEVAELGPPFADAEAQAVFEPIRCGLAGRPKPAAAEFGKTRVVAGAFQRPMDGD